MENGMPPADIGAIMGNRDGEGFGGGAWWIIILFLFVFMGGGCWGNRQGDYSQYATAASQQQILFNQQFDQINQRLTNIGNGICDSTYVLNNSITVEGRAHTVVHLEARDLISQRLDLVSMDQRSCCLSFRMYRRCDVARLPVDLR